MNATAKDLRFHSKELLEAVKKGEEVIITYRGKPCAKLIPLKTTKKKRKSANELFGIWKDHKEITDVEEYVRDLRKGRF
jgi:prevent-host-death family protein